MLTPTEFEVHQLLHAAVGYDPRKAHDYYEKHKTLKGRKRGQAVVPVGRTPARGQAGIRDKQRKELASGILSLSAKLVKLEARIREMEQKAPSENHKSTAKQERAVKETNKPKTAVEKAKVARDSRKFLKHKAEQVSGKSGDGSEDKKSASISELKALATKVKGQIAVAKQKLAAL
jgi:hypothetical protein